MASSGACALASSAFEPGSPTDSVASASGRWQILEPFLDEWLDGDEQVKGDVADRVSCRHPALLADFDELTQLFATTDVLDRPLVEVVPDLVKCATQTESGELARQGQQLGPYRLLEVLDRGGYGSGLCRRAG